MEVRGELGVSRSCSLFNSAAILNYQDCRSVASPGSLMCTVSVSALLQPEPATKDLFF